MWKSTQVRRWARDAAGAGLFRVPVQGVGVDARPAPQGLRARRDPHSPHVEEIQERKLQARADDHDIQHLSFLFGEFEPRCYLFVVFECLRRLALTGLLIFVYNGSATQVVVGLFIAVISKHIMMHFNPYIEDSDDWLANQCQLHHAVEQVSRRWRGNHDPARGCGDAPLEAH